MTDTPDAAERAVRAALRISARNGCALTRTAAEQVAEAVLGCAGEDGQRAQVENLRWQLTVARKAAERRNRDLDALHLVWCDGGCPSGVHRWQDKDVLVTEELVAAAERNTRRLRRWYEAVKFRFETYGPDPRDPSRQFPSTASEWHRQMAERAAARTDLGGQTATTGGSQ